VLPTSVGLASFDNWRDFRGTRAHPSGDRGFWRFVRALKDNGPGTLRCPARVCMTEIRLAPSERRRRITTRFAAVVVPPNRSQVVLSVGLRFAKVRNPKSACRAIWRTPCTRRTLQKLLPYALNPHKNHRLPSVGVILGQTPYQLVTVKLIV
jgi:hypothetical protein